MSDQPSPDRAPTFFDPQKLREEKQRAREKDDEDLKAGRVTPAELSRRNGLFSTVDLSKARVRRRRVLS